MTDDSSRRSPRADRDVSRKIPKTRTEVTAFAGQRFSKVQKGLRAVAIPERH